MQPGLPALCFGQRRWQRESESHLLPLLLPFYEQFDDVVSGVFCLYVTLSLSVSFLFSLLWIHINLCMPVCGVWSCSRGFYVPFFIYMEMYTFGYFVFVGNDENNKSFSVPSWDCQTAVFVLYNRVRSFKGNYICIIVLNYLGEQIRLRCPTPSNFL